MMDTINIYIPPNHMHESPVVKYVCFFLISDKCVVKGVVIGSQILIFENSWGVLSFKQMSWVL